MRSANARARVGLAMVLCATSALAQSAATLEAVKLHRGSALSLARADLAACQHPRASAAEADAGTAPTACARASQLSLLIGFLQLSAGDAAGAARQLSSQSSVLALAPLHNFYLGEALFYSGRPAQSAVSFEKASLDAPPWLLPRVNARKAEALLAAGNFADALALLDKAAVDNPSPELTWQRSLARRATGDLEGERADLKWLALKFPAHPYGAAALAQLEAAHLSPQILTFEERLTRAHELLDRGEATLALAELDAIDSRRLARGASAKARQALVRAQTLFALGLETRGEQQLDVALKGQPALAAEALMLRARRALRAGDHPRARSLFSEVERRHPHEPPADDAAFLVGWIDFQDGHPAEATSAFDAFQKRFPRSKKRDEGLWYRSLALLQMKQWSTASAGFDQLASAFPRSPLLPQARYWSVRALQLGAPDKTIDPSWLSRFQAVLNQFPGSFYAQLAQERLVELGQPAGKLFPTPAAPPSPTFPEELKLARLLAEAGLYRDSAEEVQSRMSAVHGAEQALRFGGALQTFGDFGAAHALATRLLWGAAYNSKQPQALALMYPRAFATAVQPEAKRQGSDPFLLWAIMRRESAFRPDVLSAANARGLMQMVPATARSIAAQLKVAVPDPDELFSPELNIRLASWYVAALQQRFGHPALVAAAYNAGPTVVLRWAKEIPQHQLDLWVETLPYKETRAYVKQVVADYLIYQRLYGDATPTLPLTLPSPLAEGVDF